MTTDTAKLLQEMEYKMLSNKARCFCLGKKDPCAGALFETGCDSSIDFVLVGDQLVNFTGSLQPGEAVSFTLRNVPTERNAMTRSCSA